MFCKAHSNLDFVALSDLDSSVALLLAPHSNHFYYRLDGFLHSQVVNFSCGRTKLIRNLPQSTTTFGLALKSCTEEILVDLQPWRKRFVHWHRGGLNGLQSQHSSAANLVEDVDAQTSIWSAQNTSIFRSTVCPLIFNCFESDLVSCYGVSPIVNTSRSFAHQA